MTPDPQPLDLSNPVHLRATIAREGLMYSQLSVYWTPDTDSFVDPFDDPDTRSAVRVFMAKLWTAALDAEKAAQP